MPISNKRKILLKHIFFSKKHVFCNNSSKYLFLSKTILMIVLLLNSHFWGFAASAEKLSAVSSLISPALDTSILVLDSDVSCGSNSQVRLLAGSAFSYAWYRNFEKIPGVSARNYTALISGSYSVRVYDSLGNMDSSKAVNIYIVPKPISSFSVNKSMQCFVGNEFILRNESSIEDGTFSNTWYFGDGEFQIGANSTHNYTSTGDYTIKLVSVSNYGCSDTSMLNVSVLSSPEVDFEINSPSQCLNSNIFRFTNNSSFQGAPLQYRWDFGDGGTSNAASPNYAYGKSSSYRVKLIAYSNKACSDSVYKQIYVHPTPVASYSVNNNQQCDNENYFQFTNTSSIVSGSMNQTWYFGDGVMSSAVSPNHSYSLPGIYTAQLVQISDQGCKDSVSFFMQSNPSPIAKFDINDFVQCFEGNKFNFTNLSSVTTGQLLYQWDLGDGIGLSTISNPEYTYDAAGSYLVSLRVSTLQNCVAAASKIVTINSNPVGSLMAPSSSIICEGSYIALQAEGNDAFQWFLDSLLIPGANAQTFNATNAGLYSVQFRNSQGCTSFASTNAQLLKVFQPVANFTYSNTCVNIPTLFTNASSVIESGTVDYLWNFGDGSFSTLSSPTHAFSTQGNYDVMLSVVPQACSQLAVSTTMQLVVQLAEEPIRYSPVNAIVNKDLVLKSRAFSGASYGWYPNTGLVGSIGYDPVFNHSASQVYYINIISSAGCEFTDTLEVKVFPAQEIYVPSIFSPNGDGKNDKLKPLLVGLSRFRIFRVFNRWGQLVFTTAKIDEGWDGVYLGVRQPMETYSWQAEGLDMEGKIITRTGTTILLR